MTFLRKLFRGDDRPSEAETTAPVAAPDAPPSDASPEADQGAPPVAVEDQPAQKAPDDDAWWEDAPADPEAETLPPSAFAPAAPDLAPAPMPADADAPAEDQAGDSDASPRAPADAPAEDRADASVPARATGDTSVLRDDLPASVEEGGTRPLTEADSPTVVALRSRQGFAAAGLRDIGRVRSINQDSLFALTTTLPRESSDLSMGLFIIADGMGGHSGGEVASRLAISAVVRHILAELVIPALDDSGTEALQPLIVAAVQEANRAIWEHAQAIGSDMGTTCTLALVLGQSLYMGHVGDSRAYLATPTGLRLITNDHSTVGRLIHLGQLDPSEAREHPLRSQLYRTVGQHPEVQVDFIYQPLGDATHLLLCSDGLWGMLDEEVLLDVLEHAVWPQDACRELIARANLAGGEDNISAVVVTLTRQT